jgi:hypothetical protein
MAIVENRASENGDIIVIKTNVPIVGIVGLSSFVDTTVGETGSVYFEKTFRYSNNGGLTFSDWVALTTLNIQGIVIERIDYFVIEYRYKRIGSDPVDLEFNNVTIGGSFSPLTYPVFNSMVFSNFFTVNTVDVLDWALNVLEKLYKNGIIPNYVIRNQGDEDRDFISYWFTITHFFAILVYYARGFERISSNVTLMREFVKGRGVYMRDDPDTEELYYVYSNYISEIQKRGTSDIYRQSATIDGELLRLLNNLVTDECLFAFTNRGELGWCIGESSPLYTGADNIVNLIKGYEFTEDIISLTPYPLINDSYITLVGGKIQITGVPVDEIAGVGFSTIESTGGDGYTYYGGGIGVDLIYPDQLSEDAIVIDPTLDYEISFKVEKSNASILDLSFGVSLFDKDAVEVNATRITDGIVDNRFFTLQTLNKSNTEYWVRGVLNAYNSTLVTGDKLNIGFGQNLRSPSNAAYLVPVILVENNTGVVLTDIVRIRDVKIRPAALWTSRGLLSSRNFVIGFLKNRNVQYSDIQVEKIIDEELIPYNTFSLLKFL